MPRIAIGRREFDVVHVAGTDAEWLEFRESAGLWVSVTLYDSVPREVGSLRVLTRYEADWSTLTALVEHARSYFELPEGRDQT